MATLSGKTTSGETSFSKYVTNNGRLEEIEFEIEAKMETPLFTKKSSNMVASEKVYKAGDKFKIISKKMTTFGKMKLAEVSVGGKKGFFPINKIRKPTGGNGTQYEDEVVDAINAVIRDSGGVIDIKIKGDNKTYKNMRYCVKVETPLKRKAGVKGDPKADIIICEDIKDPLKPTSIYISHKKEGGPEAFQQYGGLSKLAGSEIYNHPEVQEFMKNTAALMEGESKLPAPVMMEITDKNLLNKSIYGPDFGGKFSIQHTQLIGQGKPVMTYKKSADCYTLDFSSHMSLSGDLSHFKGGYTPVFGGTFRNGRNFEYGGKKYSGVRLGIYPKKLIESRRGLVVLNG